MTDTVARRSPLFRLLVRPAVVAGLIVVDQYTKWLVREHLALHESVPVLPFLAFTHVTNTGAAFGMLPGRNLLFIAVVSVVVVAVALSLRRFERELGGLGVACVLCIIAGGLGNLVDRVLFGHVTDFIDLRWNGRTVWPVFNIADSCTFVGVWTMVAASVFRKRPVPSGGR